MTFAQFLTEKFFDGCDTSQGYTELWVNPTRDEIRSLMKHNEHEVAGYVTTKNLYVWDREIAEHGVMRWFIPENETKVAPIYLFYNPTTRDVKVSISYWSGIQLRPEKLMEVLHSHPAFKIFHSVSYYRDE